MFKELVKTYDIHKIGENEYEITFREWHPLYWVQVALSYLFGVAIAIDASEWDGS